MLQENHDIIRVAYVVTNFDAGGLERVTAHLVNGLNREQFDPCIVCLGRNGAAANWITGDDIEIIELHKQAGNDWRVVSRLARILKQRQVDVVQSHNWGTLLETSLASRRAKVPVHIHAEHGQELDAMSAGKMRRWARGRVTKWCLMRASATVVCAESVRERVEERTRFSGSQMCFIPNGVDTPHVADENCGRALRDALGLPSKSFVVGSLSRLAPIKDFVTTIDAVKLLVDDGHDVHLVLVGEGPVRDQLASKAQNAGIESRVHLVGQQDDVGEWLGLFDLYVNSSISEAMSMGILEAMAAGLPIVATDVGDTSELIAREEPCGLVVPSQNANALASAVTRLLADENLRSTFGRRAQERYKRRYSLAKMVRHYEELYLSLANSEVPSQRLVESGR